MKLDFKVGDSVMVDVKNYRMRLDPTDQARTKLAARYIGPFKVKRRIGELAYELDVPEAQAGVAAEGGLDELRVKGFLGRRPNVLDDNGKFDYLVKWAGPAPTWQADTELPGLRWAQRRFEKRARTELELRRLRQRDTIILPDGQARADALLAASQGA
ncbi:hypothetical protein CF336_g8230 [Tilletia laevis]|nr:hypothetical protein CF336_g8230 [Tilletia laevis]KAE8185092.1 hypothetical protein CF328_g7649 [Tilletia controversa]